MWLIINHYLDNYHPPRHFAKLRCNRSRSFAEPSKPHGNHLFSPNFFLRKVPPLLAAFSQGREEPVKPLRCAPTANAAPAAGLTEPSFCPAMPQEP
jgi:hypothetical protein